MAEEMKLAVKMREQAGKDLEKNRKAGLIPAVMYGHGNNPQMFWVNYIEFEKMYARAGASSIVSLTPEGGKVANVIVHDVQFDPLKSRFSHVDFFQVRMDEELETHIPLETVGEAPAVREKGGILVKTLEEVLVSCLPKDLPHSISIDVSGLHDFGMHIQVKDLKAPSGVKFLTEADTTIILIEAPRTEAEMASLDEKIEGDVTKVEGVVKEAPVAEGTPEGGAPLAPPKEEKK